jgi:hypothetical protein
VEVCKLLLLRPCEIERSDKHRADKMGWRTRVSAIPGLKL